MEAQIAKHWRLKDERYRMEGIVCPHCGAAHFPRRAVCSECTIDMSSLDKGADLFVGQEGVVENSDKVEVVGDSGEIGLMTMAWVRFGNRLAFGQIVNMNGHNPEGMVVIGVARDVDGLEVAEGILAGRLFELVEAMDA